MWPLLLDMTREESKRVLRRLELEAYSSIISVFRAQGSLSKDKKKQLQDLQAALSISTERHRAEVRRAVNDEKLSTIADNTFGPDTSSEWLIEGRRLIPLMPRLVPQTSLTHTANQMANFQAEKNAALPTPSMTGNKDISSPIPTNIAMTQTTVAKVPRPGSPTSNVVVLPSGVSVHIKDEIDDLHSKKRKRSHSAEGVATGSGSAPLPHPRVTYTTQTSRSPSPMKITISKSPQTKTQSSLTTTPPQKVILLSSSGQSTAANILQKSMSVPVVRASSGPNTTHSSPVPKTSIIYPGGSSSSPAANGNLGNIVTVATTSAMQNVSTSMGSAPGSMYQSGFATPTGIITRPRQKIVTRQRLTPSGVTITPQRPGLVMPMGSPSVHSLTQSGHIKTVTGKPTIQIKQEGGMKIITQTLPSSKLLPKPSSTGGGSSGTPIVVVSSGSSTSSGTVTMVSRPLSSSGVSAALGSKILNITTQGGKVIATTNKNPNVVTVNPKTLHLTAVKTATGVAGGKPNVIVVQKSHGKKFIGQGTTMLTTRSGTSLPFDKDLVSFLQKHDAQKFLTAKTLDNRVILTTSAQKSRTDAEGKTSLLAELIQAASGNSSSETPSTSSVTSDSPVLIEERSTGETTPQLHLPVKAVTPALPSNLSNEWFEYDVADDLPMVTTQSKNLHQNVVEEAPSTTQLTSDQLYTIEQAMHLVSSQPSSEPSGLSRTVDSIRMQPGSVHIPASNRSQLKGLAEEKLGTVTSVVPTLNPELLQGDLDPQTGIFHSTSPVIVEQLPEAGNLTGQSMDLLSTSLAQAQIDLDPYQFMEDELVTLNSMPEQEVKGKRAQKEPLVSILTGNVVPGSAQESGTPSLAAPLSTSEPSSRASSFIPITELSSKSSGASIHVTTKGPAVPQVGSVTVSMLPKTIDPGALTLEDLTSQRLDVADNVPAPPSPEMDLAEEVTITPSSEIDLTETCITSSDLIHSQSSSDYIGSQATSDLLSSQVSTEFTSQTLFSSEQSESGHVSEQGSLSDGGQSSDSSLTRLSKRRRKPPSAYDESPPSGGTGSWIRAALGLLNKVSKVRGASKDRSDFDASSWFLYPVDPEDAPDYFTIITKPMDFSTIKKKLETCQYGDAEDFNHDMMLVHDNCNIYNPPGHQARQDCLEVFNVYRQEFARLREKWQKSHITSPVAKKMKLDKSPGKS